MSRTDQLLIAAGAAAVLLAAASAWILLAPATDPAEDALAIVPAPTGSATATGAGPSPSEAATSGIVVDVQGAVARPGIHRLPAGARVADAVAAAGGDGPTVDLDAAAAAINLARTLDDGEQIRVPARGETPTGAVGVAGGSDSTGGTDPGGATGGLVDLNTATPEELEALPGIGPVTTQKIVAARQERPFSSLEDAVDRKVMNRGQLEQIRDLATAG